MTASLTEQAKLSGIAPDRTLLLHHSDDQAAPGFEVLTAPGDKPLGP